MSNDPDAPKTLPPDDDQSHERGRPDDNQAGDEGVDDPASPPDPEGAAEGDAWAFSTFEAPVGLPGPGPLAARQ